MKEADQCVAAWWRLQLYPYAVDAVALERVANPVDLLIVCIRLQVDQKSRLGRPGGALDAR